MRIHTERGFVFIWRICFSGNESLPQGTAGLRQAEALLNDKNAPCLFSRRFCSSRSDIPICQAAARFFLSPAAVFLPHRGQRVYLEKTGSFCISLGNGLGLREEALYFCQPICSVFVLKHNVRFRSVRMVQIGEIDGFAPSFNPCDQNRRNRIAQFSRRQKHIAAPQPLHGVRFGAV